MSGGCGHPPDTDVTASPEYNFASFAGTVWKTKIKLAVADLEEYTHTIHPYLLTPVSFDTTDPNYTHLPNMRGVAVPLPAGTRVKIKQLIKDNGIGGIMWVTAALDDGTYPQKIVYLDRELLAKNAFLEPGQSYPKIWAVAPDMLEK